MAEHIIMCGTDTAQAGTHPYFIGYSDMVDGYRHAWIETDRFGRKKIRRSRSANHPADPRCPECASSIPPEAAPECLHEHVRTFRSYPPHSKCLDCGARVVQQWVTESSIPPAPQDER